jgi:hypothetical protein
MTKLDGDQGLLPEEPEMLTAFTNTTMVPFELLGMSKDSVVASSDFDASYPPKIRLPGFLSGSVSCRHFVDS